MECACRFFKTIMGSAEAARWFRGAAVEVDDLTGGEPGTAELTAEIGGNRELREKIVARK
jgi:hypothetical protein